MFENSIAAKGFCKTLLSKYIATANDHSSKCDWGDALVGEELAVPESGSSGRTLIPAGVVTVLPALPGC